MDEEIPRPNFPGAKEAAEFYEPVPAAAVQPTVPSVPQGNIT